MIDARGGDRRHFPCSAGGFEERRTRRWLPSQGCAGGVRRSFRKFHDHEGRDGTDDAQGVDPKELGGDVPGDEALRGLPRPEEAEGRGGGETRSCPVKKARPETQAQDDVRAPHGDAGRIFRSTARFSPAVMKTEPRDHREREAESASLPRAPGGEAEAFRRGRRQGTPPGWRNFLWISTTRGEALPPAATSPIAASTESSEAFSRGSLSESSLPRRRTRRDRAGRRWTQTDDGINLPFRDEPVDRAVREAEGHAERVRIGQEDPLPSRRGCGGSWASARSR